MTLKGARHHTGSEARAEQIREPNNPTGNMGSRPTAEGFAEG
jgi:hypothetical protein